MRIEQNVGVDVGAPDRTNFLQLFVAVSSITHGLNVGGLNGFVPGNLVLMMPDLIIVRENRSPVQRDMP